MVENIENMKSKFKAIVSNDWDIGTGTVRQDYYFPLQKSQRDMLLWMIDYNHLDIKITSYVSDILRSGLYQEYHRTFLNEIRMNFEIIRQHL